MEKNKIITINHRLGSEKLKFTASDKSGKPITLLYKTKNATTLEITPKSTRLRKKLLREQDRAKAKGGKK